MPTYVTETAYCFRGRVTAYTLESNTCLARDEASEIVLLAPWDDGTWWLDDTMDDTVDEEGILIGTGREVGWLELDGITYFPPPDGYNPL